MSICEHDDQPTSTVGFLDAGFLDKALDAAFISKAGNHLAVTAVVAQQGRNLSLQSVTVDLNHPQ